MLNTECSMAKKRTSIPKQVAEAVMKEYRHKCAVCGRHSPQLHHLNEDPADNDTGNLLPLCPNCHLQDAHDPTSRPEPKKLRLFRKYKDPLILDPRFHPIYRRMKFLREPVEPPNPALYKYRANELLDFVAQFQMGGFYRGKILDLLNNPEVHFCLKRTLEGNPVTKGQVQGDSILHSAAFEYRTDQIEALVVELIRYQGWVAKSAQPEL